MKAVLIPGDGIGKEISKSVVDITKAMSLTLNGWNIKLVLNMQLQRKKF